MGTLPKSAFIAGLFLLGTTASGSAEWPPQYETPFDDQGGQYDPHWVMDEATQCWAYDAHAGSDDTVTWSGDCSDGKVSGHGTLTYFDQSRMFERVTGDFSEGFLQDGHVSILWNDGSRYDGEEQNGQFNGHGTLIASDGTRYDGLWRDDKFQRAGNDTANAQQQAPANSAAATPQQQTPANSATSVLQPKPKPMAKTESGPSAPGAEKHGADSRNENVYRLAWTQFAKTLGKRLVAADGSRLMLERTETGSLRETIEHPEGASLSITFVPLGAHLGTVQDAAGKVVATFRLRDRALSAAFEDGRVETISTDASDGIRTNLRRAAAPAVSTEWYPEGRMLRRAENDTPPSRLAQKQPASVSADPPAEIASRIAAVRSIEIRAGAPQAVRHARATFRPPARALPEPTGKPQEFAFSPPRPGHRPERLAWFARHRSEDPRDAVVIRPHALQVQTVHVQPDLGALNVAPIPAETQHRIALALRHRENRHEQLAVSTSSEYKPASDTASEPSASQHIRQRVARNDDPGYARPAHPAVPQPATAHAIQRLAENHTPAGDPPIHASSPTPVQIPQHLQVAHADSAMSGLPANPTPALQLQSQAAQATPLKSPSVPTVVAVAPQLHISQPTKPEVSADPPSAQAVGQPLSTKSAANTVPQMHTAAPSKHSDEIADAVKSNVAAPVQQSAQSQTQDRLAFQTPRPVSPPKQATVSLDKPTGVSPSTPVPAAAAGASAPQHIAVIPKRDDKHDTTLAALAPTPSLPQVAQSPAPPVISVPPPALHSIGAGPTPRRSASDCLTVQSDGTHWGFRNHCPADIQFSYCLLNSSDRLISCSVSVVSGSVAGNGFSALVADSSIKDPRASRAFRWVGCVGGAGEVSPRLDRIDPPMGRCLHSGELPQGVERADVAAHSR